MNNKKATENAVLAVIGIGLIAAAVVLLSKKRKTRISAKSEDDNSRTNYDDYDPDASGLHVFSETGILL